MEIDERPPLSSLLPLVLALGIIGLCGLGFVLWRGWGQEEAALPAGPKEETVSFPMPPPPPGQTPEELARGFYALNAGAHRFLLHLQEEQRFRFVSSIDGAVKREGTGTWALAGPVLTLTYTRVTGQPAITEETPQVARNHWSGRTIELGDTGLEKPVVLSKRTVLLQR